MTTSINRLQHHLKENDIDIAYLHSPANIAYFTNFLSDPHERVLALFIFPDQDPFLFTPELDKDDAKKSGWPYPIYGYKDSEDPYALIYKHVTDRISSPKNIGIETDEIPYGRFMQLGDRFDKANPVDITSTINQMRLIKQPDEIEEMILAGKSADLALQIGFDALEVGISESAVVAEIEYEMKKRGISMSFATEVLFGGHAANPHGVPGERTLQKGEFALFDLGTYHNRYASDVTRTFSFGDASDEHRKVYDVVLEANEKAMAAVKPGVTASSIDQIAREIIENAGYGEYFTHRTGHGIGQSIHEFPSIVVGNDMVIQEGMCFSVEPGIYIPDEVGVRIEDCLYVTADGAVPFTELSKSFTQK